MGKQLIKRAAALLAALSLLPAQPVCAVRHFEKAGQEVVFTNVTGLPFPDGEPFKGVDVSSVISLENSGVRFYDSNGNEQDIFRTLADAGVNTVRVRIWNDPYHSATHQNYGGGICDVDNAEKIAKRCADNNLKLLVDFHYSDFWADPGKQKAPKAWANYTVSQKADAIYQFTAETLARLGKTGAEIAMVQVGNETTTGMCGVMLEDYNWNDTGWNALASLFNAGAKAVRAYSKNTLVALHFTNPEKASNMAYLAKMLRQTNVDYDVFATSYYPYWHGTLGNLTAVLTNISQTYGKKVLVAETSRVRTLNDRDGFPNTVGDEKGLGEYEQYEVSPAGQSDFLHDVFRAVAAVPDGMGIGVFYWEPAWLGVGTDAESNRRKWEEYGSGWANEAAGEYDESARKYAGGSCVENEALFDDSGVPLAGLYAFRDVTGQKTDGTTYGKNLLQNPGFEADGSWSDHPQGWILSPRDNINHFDVRAEDAHTGEFSLHWWGDRQFRHCIAETEVTLPEDGQYIFSFYVQGDTESSYIVTLDGNGGENGTISGKCKGWSLWQNPVIDTYGKAGDKVKITISISGAAGSYGSVDDCCFCAVKYPEPPPDVEGDLNGDFRLDQKDLQLFVDYLLGKPVTLAVPEEADRNRDGQLDARDLSLYKMLFD